MATPRVISHPVVSIEISARDFGHGGRLRNPRRVQVPYWAGAIEGAGRGGRLGGNEERTPKTKRDKWLILPESALLVRRYQNRQVAPGS
jgi:hypothetical protein